MNSSFTRINGAADAMRKRVKNGGEIYLIRGPLSCHLAFLPPHTPAIRLFVCPRMDRDLSQRFRHVYRVLIPRNADVARRINSGIRLTYFSGFETIQSQIRTHTSSCRENLAIFVNSRLSLTVRQKLS